MSEVIPGGFFVYHEEGKRELIYANKKVLEIYGCETLDEFKELTGYTFEGMVHPDDFPNIQAEIDSQIDDESGDSMDHVEYRITRKDGKIRWVDDYGHYSYSPEYGDVYYVFISDITDKKELLKEESELAKRSQRVLDDIERLGLSCDDSMKEHIDSLRQELDSIR